MDIQNKLNLVMVHFLMQNKLDVYCLMGYVKQLKQIVLCCEYIFSRRTYI